MQRKSRKAVAELRGPSLACDRDSDGAGAAMGQG